ncbi:SIS domain-containing protein [archaeon]|jgi:D-sedoheptulose 7-phosphate isomerase|nr:SIS domain-containing protein [archaeon]
MPHCFSDVNDFMKIGGLRIVSLTNISVVTALANDFSYEDIFVKQLESLMDEGDVIIGISGSGNSMNVVKALEYARDCCNFRLSKYLKRFIDLKKDG